MGLEWSKQPEVDLHLPRQRPIQDHQPRRQSSDGRYRRPDDGTNLQIWDFIDHDSEKWTVTPAGDGFFKLTAVHSGKLADVNGGSTADGATIIQWPSNGGDNQQWSFSPAP